MFTITHSLRVRPRFPSILRACARAVALLGLLGRPVLAAENPRADAEAPPGQVVLQHTRGGAFFIASSLKEEYDRLLARTRALQADLESERITGAQARMELDRLKERLTELRQTIDKQKVLVTPVKVHQQTQTTEFTLGPSRMLVITADNVRVEGWDGPGVRCVLEKTVLAPDDKPVDGQLNAIKVVHRHGLADAIVGKSSAERDADEQKFLATPDGAKLTATQRESRRKFVQQIADGYSEYAAFQGKEIDTLEIDGLTADQGNRQITIGIKSPNGGTSLGGDWQRHAAFTVYVPTCNAVALRGCLVNLDVKGVRAALLVSNDGSHDRDYNGAFRIRDVQGPLTVDNVPAELIENIRGNTTLHCTVEMVNTGSQHEGGQRTLYTPPPRTLVCRNIQGDLVARFIRSDLRIESTTGLIDVVNEFGNTALAIAAPLPARAHRVLSESGSIELHLSRAALGQLPFQALTNCGTIRTNAPQQTLEDTSFAIGRGSPGGGRAWRGLKTRAADPASFFADIERLPAVLLGQERSPGLDVISRGGAIRVVLEADPRLP